MPESNSLTFFNNSDRAERYHQKKGFAPERTANMREVMLDLITTLTSPQSTALELGAGTGIFTEKLLRTHHFREIYVTDGAPAMLQIAQQTLEAEKTLLHFIELDFTTDWPGLFTGIRFDVITSSMALHHAADKQQLFQQIFSLLKPKGVFVFADHMAGASAWTQDLLLRERALVRLGRENKENHERIKEIMREDDESGRREGNLCESVAQYESYLNKSGFDDVECVWRDYWLAIFVARRQS